MPLAKDVAAELRKLADCFDKQPDANIPSAYMSFSRDYGKDDKERFLNVAKIMPRPLRKEWTDCELRMEYKTAALYVVARIDRADVCELVEPAKPAVYRCDPILSAEDEAELEVSHV